MTSCYRPDFGSPDKQGYLQFTLDGKQWKVHRYIYAQHHNYEFLPGEVVMHTCDNPWCGEITHLVLGVQKDNIRDMHEKGRYGKPGQSISDADVEAIKDLREAGWPLKDIAKDYHISEASVSRITRGLQR